MLKIDDLWVEIEGKSILKGLNLEIKPGEVHALMGPNGAGKSTLGKVLAGHPSYDVTRGTVQFNQEDLLELDADARVHKGLFLTFQYPVEVPGVSNFDFLYESYKAQQKAKEKESISESEFKALLETKMKELKMRPEFLERSVNEGFSGGEKKKNEILQMSVFDPKLTLLDETDSGLDIDSMKIVADGINSYKSEEKGVLLITHYQRLLDYVKPDFIHVIIDGKIVATKGAEFARELEEQGYDIFLETATS